MIFIKDIAKDVGTRFEKEEIKCNNTIKQY